MSGNNALLPTKTTFLAVPIKEPNLHVDWTSTLTTLLSNAEVDSNDFKDAIISLNNLRIKSKDSIETCIKYFEQLEIIASKFNITNQMEFIWSDAFNPHQIVHQNSIAYEKANVLFNLGALYSQANGLKKTKEESLKYAGIIFQQAASVFHHISHNFINPPLRDLSSKILEFLERFMLAQAQECCLLKSMVDGTIKLDNRSKIAAGTYKLYYDAYKNLKSKTENNSKNDGNDSENNEILDHHLHTWINTARSKCIMMKVIMNWFEGELALEGSSPKQGKGILRLQEAIRYLSRLDDIDEKQEKNKGDETKGSDKHENDDGISSSLSFTDREWGIKIKDYLSIKLKKAIHENNVIFCQSTPTPSDLEEITPVIIVKITELNSLLSSHDDNGNSASNDKNIISNISSKTDNHHDSNGKETREDLFSSFIPLRVFEEVSKYSEEKSKLVRYETLKVNSADNELQSILCSLGFPQSLDNYESVLNLEIPQIIRSLQSQCENGGSYLSVWKTFKAILNDELFPKLKSMENNLSNEMMAYQSALVDYGDRWVGIEPSHKENNIHFQKLKEFQNTLDYMKKSLEMDVSSFERSHFEEFHVLFDKKENGNVNGNEGRKIKEYFGISSSFLIDGNNVSSDDKMKEMVQEIRSKLSLIDTLVKDRAIQLESFRKFVLQDDISQKLAIAKSSLTTKLVDEELKKFDDPCRYIEENCEKQGILLQEISTLWNQRIQSGKHDNFSSNISRVQECYNAHKDLIDKLVTFLQSKPFMDIQKNIEETSTKIDNWVTERMREMQVIQYDLDNIKAEGTHKMLLDKLAKLKNSKSTLENEKMGKLKKETETNKNQEKKEERNISKDGNLDQKEINNLLQRKLSNLEIKEGKESVIMINNGESLLD